MPPRKKRKRSAYSDADNTDEVKSTSHKRNRVAVDEQPNGGAVVKPKNGRAVVEQPNGRAVDVFDYRPGQYDAANVLRILTAIMAHMPTTQKWLRAYGGVKEPRLSTMCSVDGHSMAYSGLTQRSDSKLDSVLNELVVKSYQLTGIWFDIMLVNCYRTGADYVSPHHDKDSIGKPVGSFSFGAEREFRAYYGHPKQCNRSNLAASLVLQSGSFLLMPAGFQEKYTHCVPKITTNKCGTRRINVTLRQHNTELCAMAVQLAKFNKIPLTLINRILSFLFWDPNLVV